MIIYDEEINTYKSELRDIKFKEISLPETIKDRLELIKNNSASESININGLLYTLDTALKYPQLIDPDILTTYVAQLIPLMENAGAGPNFTEYLDRAIEIFHSMGRSITDLYLAKRNYLRLINVDNPEVQRSIEEAIRYAQNSDELLKSLLILGEHYIDISEYQKAIGAYKKCQELIDDRQDLVKKYQSPMLSWTGVAYFYLFDYHSAIENLENAYQTAKVYSQDRYISETNHYLGRIATAQGDSARAMRYYSIALYYQELCPEELLSMIFHHLRIGELLVSVNLISQARDHLMESQRLCTRMQNVGSAQIQVDLAFSDIYLAENNYHRAKQTLFKAIDASNKRKFYRGELLGLEKLFRLQLKRLMLPQMIYTAYRAIRTLRGGEMKRNNMFKLLFVYISRSPLILFKSIIGSSYNVMSPINNTEIIKTCTCSMHSKGNFDIELV